jgi:acetyltransferase EpsM
MNDLLLWGAGGHGKVVVDIARSTRRFRSISFLDDDPTTAGTTFYGCPVAGGRDDLERFSGYCFAITIGDNRTRASCFRKARAQGLTPVALIHTSAVVSPSAVIGAGTVVMPGAVVNADAVVGENCIINSCAVVGHDARIADHVHFGSRAVLGGAAKIGPYAHVALGAVILPQVEIEEFAVVGAGAVLLKNAAARSTMVGVPARVMVRTLERQEEAGV